MSKKQKKKHKLKAKNLLEQDEEDDNSDKQEEIKDDNDGVGENNTKDDNNLLDENFIASNVPEVEEACSKPSICSVCKKEFSSRNKLFDHIKAEGHAIVKTVQQPKSKKTKSKNKK